MKKQRLNCNIRIQQFDGKERNGDKTSEAKSAPDENIQVKKVLLSL